MIEHSAERNLFSEIPGNVRQAADLVKTHHWSPDHNDDWYIKDRSVDFLVSTQYTRRDRDKMDHICKGITGEGIDRFWGAIAVQVLYKEANGRVVEDGRVAEIVKSLASGGRKFDEVDSLQIARMEEIAKMARRIDTYVAKQPGMEIFLMDLVSLAAMRPGGAEGGIKIRTEPFGSIEELIKRYIRHHGVKLAFATVQSFLQFSSKFNRADWFDINGVSLDQFDEPEIQKGIKLNEPTLVAMGHADQHIRNPRALDNLFRDVGPYFIDKIFKKRNGEVKIAMITSLPESLDERLKNILLTISANYGQVVIDARKASSDTIRELRRELMRGSVLAGSPEQCASGRDFAPAKVPIVQFAKLLGVTQIVPVSTIEYIKDAKFRYKFIANSPLIVPGDFWKGGRELVEKKKQLLADAIMYVIAQEHPLDERGAYGIEWLMEERGVKQLLQDLGHPAGN